MKSGENTQNANSESNWKKSIVVYLHDLIYMLMAVLLVFLLLFRVIVVSGDSMYSTLLDGDYVSLFLSIYVRIS